MLVPFARKHLRTELPSLAAQVADGPGMGSFLLIRRYTGSSLVLFRRGGEPFLVYKLAADKSLNWFVDNAVACIQEARRHGLPTQTVCATGRLRGRAFVVYSWLPGTSLHDRVGGPAGGAAVLERAVTAITDLHVRTRRPGGLDPDAVEGRCQWWKELLWAHPALPGRFRPAIDRVLSLLLEWVPRLPAVLMHGDCATVNLLRDEQDRMAFIDWELGLPAGLPGVDLVTLLVHHPGFAAGAGGLGPAFARCFLDRGPTADECWRVLRTYAARLGLPEEAMGVLAAATHLKLVAESRHYSVLHHGPWRKGRTAEELQVLDRLQGAGAGQPLCRPGLDGDRAAEFLSSAAG